VTPVIRLPIRRLPKPAVIASIGVAVLALIVALSLAGMPAPAGVAQGGAGDDRSPAPTATEVPPAPVLNAPHQSASKRRAFAETSDCRHGPRTLGPAEAAYHGDRDTKVVALTFDDGWGRRSTRMILRTLQDKRVNATFFPVGQAVRHDPDTWRRVAAAGFPIADHTYDHATLEGGCFWSQRIELSRAGSTIRKVLGITPLPVMRPPGGFFDDATLSAAGAVGEQTLVMWDVDTHDWTGIGTRQVRRNALAGTKGSIIVLHTSSLATARALPDIVRGYRKRGFEFVTIGQLLGIDGAVPYPPETEG